MVEREEVPVVLHSKKIMTSYSFGNIVGEFVEGVLVFMLFFFYETEVGLQSWLTGLALGIYAVYDAINDPLVGYLTDRPFKFTKKYGRRFPWIIIGFVPMMISFLLIFNPPPINAQEQPLIIFGWLIFTTCLFDTTESIFTINFYAIFPDKFRDRDERVTASGLGVYIGFIGVVLAFILPPMIVIFGQFDSYIFMGWICVIIAFVCWGILLPGARDDKEVVDHYIKHYDEVEKESFFKALSQAFRQKTFATFLIMYLMYQALTNLMTSSLWYNTKYNLQTEADAVTIISILLMVGGLIGVPIWLKYREKTENNKRTMLLAGFLMAIAAGLVTIFATSFTGILVLITIFGIGLGGFWVMLAPVFSDVVDESVTITGKRREGMYGGFRFFMGNIAKVLQAFTLAFVHEITGFVETADVQTPLAKSGIALHIGLLPAIYMIIGLLIFWKFYDITPEKAENIKEKLMQLKI